MQLQNASLNNVSQPMMEAETEPGHRRKALRCNHSDRVYTCPLDLCCAQVIMQFHQTAPHSLLWNPQNRETTGARRLYLSSDSTGCYEIQ